MEEAAEILGVSVRQVHRYCARGCPDDSVEAIVQWRDSNINTERDNDKADGSLSRQLLAEKVRVERAKADKLEMENRQAAGLLVESDDVRRVLGQFCALLKERLLQVPELVMAEVPAEYRTDVYARTGEVVNACLTNIANLSFTNNSPTDNDTSPDNTSET